MKLCVDLLLGAFGGSHPKRNKPKREAESSQTSGLIKSLNCVISVLFCLRARAKVSERKVFTNFLCGKIITVKTKIIHYSAPLRAPKLGDTMASISLDAITVAIGRLCIDLSFASFVFRVRAAPRRHLSDSY